MSAMRGRILAIACVLGACGDSGALAIDHATPPYAALAGGSVIELAGSGFAGGDLRVLIGGREAPLATALGDSTLRIVVPPGDRAGDAEIVVFDTSRAAHATGIFHYSEAPVIEAVSPADVVYASGVRMTVTGRGFVDEGAGTPQVVVDGIVAEGVDVASDTSLSFFAPVGRALTHPTLQIANARGIAEQRRAFRYTPSDHPGLLVFPQFGASFAEYVDPVTRVVISIPSLGAVTRFTAVIRDAAGDYWAIDRGGRFGRIDMATQQLEAPAQTFDVFPAMVRHGSEVIALDRSTLRFGTFDPTTTAFVPFSPAVSCCGSYGVASDGEHLYYTSRQGFDGTPTIATLDRATGELGPPVPITASPGFHVEDLRWLAGTLYATSRDQTLVTIDPTTGATTVVPVAIDRANAMEVFQ